MPHASRGATHQPEREPLQPSGNPSGTPLSAPATQENGTHFSILRTLLPFVWPKDRPDLRRRVVLAGIVLVLAKLVTVLTPFAYKHAVDWLTAADANTVQTALTLVPVMLIVAYGVCRVMMMVFTQIRDVLFTRVGQNAVRHLSDMTFRHLHNLSLRFHLERKTGGLSRVIERGRGAVELILRLGILNSIPTVLEFLLVLGVVAYLFGSEFVLVIGCTVAAYIAYTFKASEWRLAIRREWNESDNEANTKAVDSLLNYETVKYFGNEEWEARRFDHSMEKYERSALRTYVSLSWLNIGQSVIFTTGLTICMLLSARGITQGVYTVGDFVMINAQLIQLYVPLNFLGMIYRELKQGLIDIEAMFELLNRDAEITDAPHAKPLVIADGHIRFENVHFAYDPARQILKGIDFEVPAGKMVAIVGPSGAGKSTISRLLFRFYAMQKGRITIDGQDIAQVQQASLRASIGMVPQDTVLFNDTIGYNIRYGRPTASEDEVRAAARMAQIDEFIQMLPDGYKTQVGERGLKLSGGEKQRVAIARTILKGPPILMLDEATSALDSFTEKQIQGALDRVAENRTTLVIAHRLSTIIHADQILVLQAGQIVERGTHAELLAQKGLYAGMWARQREVEQVQQRAKELAETEVIPPQGQRFAVDEPVVAE
jgi:ABC-type transport system involved in Fe-S cluster assembly fused permease/ATPase subunit